MYTDRVGAWPITIRDVEQAQTRIGPLLGPTPLRNYPSLDRWVGNGISVWVKHENHQPTNSFKVRNGLAVLSALSLAERQSGVVAASRGNHGQGLGWAGRKLEVKVTICVPLGNNPEKNEAMRDLGVELVESGKDYDEAVAVAHEICAARGMRLVHSTNDPLVLAGAGTVTLEMFVERPNLEALVVAVGGGSCAVGALTVARALRPGLPVYAVQAAGAAAIHDSYHARTPLERASADTIADGLATRQVYELTFESLCEGLAGFVTVSDGEIAQAVRTFIRQTHNLSEGAGATGLAGLMKLKEELAGKCVGVILTGSNIDENTLRKIIGREI